MHRQFKHTLANQKGFTLIELVLVIVLIGIVSAISAPKLSTMAANADFRADARNLLSAMKTARMEAVKRNENCAITFTTDAGGFDIYTVYVDDNGDLKLDAGETVLINGVFQNAIITSNNIDANADGDPAVTFTGRGMPLNDTGGFGAGTIVLLGSSSRQKTTRSGNQRSIILNTVGRLTIR